MNIPEKILQAGCDAYAAKFLHGNGSLGDGIEAAYFAIHEHDDWVRAGPPAWSGEGLPPAGTVCEWLDPDSGRWLKSVIAFLSSWVIVVRGICPHPDGPVDIAFDLNKIHPKFRPIRTPEQIAAEEREGSIHEMVDHLKRWNTVQDLCGDLYDAGYRKVEQP